MKPTMSSGLQIFTKGKLEALASWAARAVWEELYYDHHHYDAQGHLASVGRPLQQDGHQPRPVHAGRLLGQQLPVVQHTLGVGTLVTSEILVGLL